MSALLYGVEGGYENYAHEMQRAEAGDKETREAIMRLMSMHNFILLAISRCLEATDDELKELAEMEFVSHLNTMMLIVSNARVKRLRVADTIAKLKRELNQWEKDRIGALNKSKATDLSALTAKYQVVLNGSKQLLIQKEVIVEPASPELMQKGISLLNYAKQVQIEARESGLTASSYQDRITHTAQEMFSSTPPPTDSIQKVAQRSANPPDIAVAACKDHKLDRRSDYQYWCKHCMLYSQSKYSAPFRCQNVSTQEIAFYCYPCRDTLDLTLCNITFVSESYTCSQCKTIKDTRHLFYSCSNCDVSLCQRCYSKQNKRT